jgi:signal transduction histidine kinase
MTRTSEPDLPSIIQAYNAVTERLKRSHEALAREVCRLREELHEKNKELGRRERLAALGEMAAGVAHEIRNPLGGIGLYASLLDRDLADRPEQRALVRKLAVGVRNLDNIVGDILMFAGDAEPDRHRATLGEIVEGVIDQTAPKALASGIHIDVDPALSSAQVYCDAAQVERAMINLVLNAIDAVSSGGHVWIRLDARRTDGRLVRVWVEDDGPGIEPDLAHRIFNPFYTTKHTGTGLGLAIVHRLAEMNGGSVRAGSRRGGGAAFLLVLPSAELGARDTMRAPSEQPSHESQALHGADSSATEKRIDALEPGTTVGTALVGGHE